MGINRTNHNNPKVNSIDNKNSQKTKEKETKEKREMVKLYGDNEMGSKDIFFKGEDGKWHKNINWEKLKFEQQFKWLKDELEKILKDKELKQKTGKDYKIIVKVKKQINELAEKSALDKIGKVIEQEATKVREWIDDDKLNDEEKNRKAYIDAQESIFCLFEAYKRVYRRQLEKLKETSFDDIANNEQKGPKIARRLKKIFNDKKYFQPKMHPKQGEKEVIPGQVPDKKDSLVLQVAYEIEDRRKGDPDDPEEPEEEGPRQITDQEWRNEKKKYDLKISAVDQIVEAYAWRQAEEKLRQMLHSPEAKMSSRSRLKSLFNNLITPLRHPVKFVKKSWVRMAEQGYLKKFYLEALEEIATNQNLMAEIKTSFRLGKDSSEIDAESKREINYEILDKVIEQYSNNVAEQEERGEAITEKIVEQKLQTLITRSYLQGWDRETFEKEQHALINRMRIKGQISNQDFLGRNNDRDETEINRGLMYASNLFHIAQNFKNQMEKEIGELGKEEGLNLEQKKQVAEHVKSMLKLDIEAGAKFSDLHNKRPAGTMTWMDKSISWMQECPILGRIVSNPGSMAVIGAVGSNLIARKGLKIGVGVGAATVGVVTGAWIPVLSAGVAAGVFGAVRRNWELKKDRAMDQRQKILGKEMNDFRRKKLDRFEYDVRSSNELQKEIDEIKQAGKYETLSEEQKKQLASVLARFKIEIARDKEYRLGKRNNRTVDLIAVLAEEGEKYGTNLVSKTDLKIDLYKYLEENKLISEKEHKLLENDEFNEYFNQEFLRFNNNINQADKSFDQYRRKSALTMGAIAGMSGAVLAGASQEIINYFKGGSAYTALDSIKDALGEDKLGQIKPTISFGGKELPLNELTEVKYNGEDVGKIFVNNKGEIDLSKSKLSEQWSFNDKDYQLMHKVPGGVDVETLTDWDKITEQLEIKPSEKRISYAGFKYQGSAPEPGIRAKTEILANLANNLKLHANNTELMMDYQLGENGEVVVDASRMIGKTLKEASGDKGEVFKELLNKGKIKLALSLDNSKGGSQHHPILLEMGADGKIKIPKKLASVFFGFDEEGHLLKSPGDHPGLHSLIIDTGRENKNGDEIVEQIASTLGERPKLEVRTEFDKWEGIPLERTEAGEFTQPTTVPLAGTSRWQLENEGKKGRQEKTEEESSERRFKFNNESESNDGGDVIEADFEEMSEEEARGKDVIRLKREGNELKRITPEVKSIEKITDNEEGDEIKSIKEFFSFDDKEKNKVWNEKEIKSNFSKLDELKKIFKDDLFLKDKSEIYTFKGKMDSLIKAINNEEELNREDNETLREINKYYQKATKSNIRQIEKLTFPQFIYCLQRGLSEIIKEQ